MYTHAIADPKDGILVGRRPELDELREALRLRTKEHFTALAIANALGGTRTAAWALAHTFTADELRRELAKRGDPTLVEKDP